MKDKANDRFIHAGYKKERDFDSSQTLKYMNNCVGSSKTVPEAKAGSYSHGQIINIYDYSKSYRTGGNFMCFHYSSVPSWTVETNNVMFEIDGSEGLQWLIHLKLTGDSGIIMSFEEASRIDHLFNNTGVIAFDHSRKKLFSIIDNEIYSIKTKKETL